MKDNRSRKKTAVYAVLLILYLITSTLVRVTSMSGGVLSVSGHDIPVGLFTGVLSSMSNMCLIVMVVYCGRRGFITALVLAVIQFPLVLASIIRNRNFSSIPGVFGNILVLTVIIMIYRRNRKIEDLRRSELDAVRESQRGARRLFEQTATALVNAIDAKDEYSRGHSQRVAEYSREIAYLMGKSEEECIEIYYAGLLHDVGKIGIADRVLNKKGKLTEEEYEIIKTHSKMGKQILSGISEYPYLSIGANHHHERYDGKGYPDKLKGTDIPEIARIIAVADSYDAMSSNRSYRDALPQQLVREEIVKGAGTQFDPNIARIMQHMIDIDTEYHMKERSEVKELAGKNELKCTGYREEISEGILITNCINTIRMSSTPDEGGSNGTNIPSLIVFDSLDGRVHDEEKTIKDLNYFEYGQIRFDGTVTLTGARCHEMYEEEGNSQSGGSDGTGLTNYTVETVRVKDHISVKINDGSKVRKITIALPDSARFAYIALTGEKCHITDVSIAKSEESVPDDYIERIAPFISYIDGPEGDVPNVQIDGYRMDTTQGIPVTNGLTVTFHSMSLPTARLIWHCPYVVLYSSDDGMVNGKNYIEYALVRIDGENWEAVKDDVMNDMSVKRSPDFAGWDIWKECNKRGIDCKVIFVRTADSIIMKTDNLGVSITNITHISDKVNVYASLTGDQCALTDIRIRK